MFLTVKGKSILAATLIFLAVAALCITMSITSAPSSNVPKVGKTIVIDAGHGGVDGGVQGKSTGIKESEINLAIAKLLEDYLIENGFDVVMTRTTSDGLYKSGVSSKKLSDMNARRTIIEGAKPDMVVSIHQNSYPLSSVSGPQVFYYQGSETSEGYANAIQKVLNSTFKNDREAKTGDYYMLSCTEFPSVLVECGFLSNANEESLLASAKYQARMAYAIYSAVHMIFAIDETAQTINLT